jgi:hypothetical protein
MEFLSDRISVVKNDAGTSIVIAAVTDKKKNRFVLLLLLLWIVGGIVMIWSFPTIAEDKTKLVVIIWLAFWAYFLYVLARLWRWKQHGFEVIKINGDVFKYKRDVKGRGWVNDYKLTDMKNVRPSGSESPNWLKNMGGDFWNTDCDSIRFDFEDKEVSLGYQLSAKEQKSLIHLLSEFISSEEMKSRRQQKAAEWEKGDS